MTELKPLKTLKRTKDILHKLVEEERWSAENAMFFLNTIPDSDVAPKSEVAREVAAEFKEFVKQHLLSLGIYPVLVKNAMEYAESKLQKKYMGGNNMSYNNTCICCGRTIPEGRQVCPTCEKDLAAYNTRIGAKSKTIGKFVATDGVQLTIDDVEENI